MTQQWIPAAFYRGGSSKGVVFHARDLPADRAATERIFLAALGSPDPFGRQLDGMGGGSSSLSKAVIIGPPTHPEADVDYTFAQVAVDRPVVDWAANCGNMSSVVGPFAVDEGLVRVEDGEALLRIHQVNTGKIIHARFPVRGGLAEVEGDFAMAGVPGTGARIALDFLSPGGTLTAGLLPTGNVTDTLRLPDGGIVEVSLVDATNPVVFVHAAEMGMTGTEPPGEIEADGELMARLDAIRRAGGVAMGLGADLAGVPLVNPKIAIVSHPAPFPTLDGAIIGTAEHDLGMRMLSMEQAHRAVTLTGALCAGVACQIPGTVPRRLLGLRARAGEVRIGHPSGVITVGAAVRREDGWVAERATVFRTARRLMQGQVAIRQAVLKR